MEIFTIFILYIYTHTELNMEESKERATEVCETIYWHTDKSSNETVQELCGGVWKEVYGYEKK